MALSVAQSADDTKEFRSSGVQEFRSSGVQRGGDSKIASAKVL
jgi:hypothetical protein